MRERIVLASDSQEPSGMGEHMLTLGATLGANFDVTLALPAGEPGATLLRRAARKGLRVKAIDPSRLDLFRHWLTRMGADLVHVHAGIGWEGHGLVRAAKGAGIPVVRTEHLPYLLTSVVQQAEYRAMLLSVDCRIAVSEAAAQSHAGHGKGRLQVVQNGIVSPIPSASRAEKRAELGLAADDQLILTVARFTAQKGYDVLLEAAPVVLAAHPLARFILVGSGPEQAAIEASIAERGLANQVQVLGARPDVADLLASADLFVLPSNFEGLPLVVLEAMAASVPVVATRIGGTVEALGSAHPLLVAPGDPEALAGAIATALSDPVMARKAVQTASDRFHATFKAERMARQTASIYRTLLSDPALRGTGT